MQKRITLIFSLILFFSAWETFAQTKRPLDFDVYENWKAIRGATISSDGKWVVYSQKAQNKDATLKIHKIGGKDEKVETFARGEQAKISYDSRFVVFTIKPYADSVKALRRKKVKRSKLPKNALGIYNLRKDSLIQVNDVKSFKLPKKSGTWLAYHLEPGKNLPKKPKKVVKDTTEIETPEAIQETPVEETEKKEKKKKKNKKEEEEETPVEEVVEEVIEETPLEIAQKRIQELENELKKIEEEKKAKEERKKNKPQKPKAENTINGSKLILRNLTTARQDTFQFVKSYEFDETGRKLSFVSTGNDSTFKAGVYVYDLENNSLTQVLNLPGKHVRMNWDKAGTQLAFISDTDTSKAHKKSLNQIPRLILLARKAKNSYKNC